MSDPLDMVSVSTHVGTGVGGAAGVGLLLKMVWGSAIENVRTQITTSVESIRNQLDTMRETIADSRADTKESLLELKADTREQITSLKDQIERSDRRHDGALQELGVLRSAYAAEHQRLDKHADELDSVKRRLTAVEMGLRK